MLPALQMTSESSKASHYSFCTVTSPSSHRVLGSKVIHKMTSSIYSGRSTEHLLGTNMKSEEHLTLSLLGPETLKEPDSFTAAQGTTISHTLGQSSALLRPHRQNNVSYHFPFFFSFYLKLFCSAVVAQKSLFGFCFSCCVMVLSELTAAAESAGSRAVVHPLEGQPWLPGLPQHGILCFVPYDT